MTLTSPVEGAGAVAFECEQVLQVWKIDSIRWRIGSRCAPGPSFCGVPGDRGVEVGGRVFEVAAGVAEIADHEEVAVALAAFEQRQAEVAFGRLWRGEDERAWVPSSANRPWRRKPETHRS